MSRTKRRDWVLAERPPCPGHGHAVPIVGSGGLLALRSPAGGPAAAWARLRDEHGAALRRFATIG